MKIQINNIQDLISLIDKHYDSDLDLIHKTTSAFFNNLIIISFGKESKKEFSAKVMNFYNELMDLTEDYTKPVMLVQKINKEFSIKDIF